MNVDELRSKALDAIQRAQLLPRFVVSADDKELLSQGGTALSTSIGDQFLAEVLVSQPMFYQTSYDEDRGSQLSSFEVGLRKGLESDKVKERDRRRILRVLDARPSKARTRRLDRMERHARAELGVDWIDWSTVDWAKIIQVIVSVLLALLTFL